MTAKQSLIAAKVKRLTNGHVISASLWNEMGHEELLDAIDYLQVNNPLISTPASGGALPREPRALNFDIQQSSRGSLSEHILSHISDMPYCDDDVIEACRYLARSLCPNGFYPEGLKGLVEVGFSKASAEEALHIINHIEPVGLGAQDHISSIRIQLEHYGVLKTEEGREVLDHLYTLFSNPTNVSPEALTSIATLKKLLRKLPALNPFPGRAFEEEAITVATRADVLYTTRDNTLCYELTSSQIKLHINESKYRELLKLGGRQATIANKLKAEAQQVIDLINQRSERLEAIAAHLLQVQGAHLANPKISPSPLTGRSIAAALGYSESSVSRFLANKYYSNEWGIYPLKKLVPGARKAGGQYSPKDVEDAISRLINSEDTDNPLTDIDVVDKLLELGISAKRRYVSKLRAKLGIPSARQRRVIKQ